MSDAVRTDATPAALAEETHVARPLRVLVSLIERDLKEGRAAAERAALPHYKAAGEKLREAKTQLAHGEFMGWVKRHFKISQQTATLYMRFAQNEAAVSFSSLSDFQRHTTNPTRNAPRVDAATLNLTREQLKRADEREAERVLALDVIASGYRMWARKLHPDKGGSREAMARLNRVRDRLKQWA